MKSGDGLKYSALGNTGFRVSEICAGTLTIGPLQASLPLEEGRSLLSFACDLGVNFFDSAEYYHSYEYMAHIARRSDVVIAGRSYAHDGTGMRKSLDDYRRSLARDTVDIFGLHEQESSLTLKGHRQALEYLANQRERGLLGAVLVSTHYVGCVRAASLMDEVDVIFAILNVGGIGIADGAKENMEEALRFAKDCGKGVYLMKALGGGHLHKRASEALSYARDFPHKDSVAIGFKTVHEIRYAEAVFSRESVDPSLQEAVIREPKRLVIEGWCVGCGRCVERCGYGALSLLNGKAVVEADKCVLCGYCGGVCPEFCIKIM